MSTRPVYFTIAVTLALFGCGRSDHLIGANGSPIILITIDTLRSDHLPAYGYAKIETPAIDEFRRDAILYERAYSECPLTLVSHASIFTGLLPADHGIRDNVGYDLKKGVRTLAEELKGKGFSTGAAVSAIVLRRETGINRGFDYWEDDIEIDPNFLSMGRAQRPGDDTREIAQRWISSNKAKPFFFFLHLYEPHTPYEPLEPFRSRYGASYDGDVATADAVFGRFMAYLKAEGIYDRATIILLSDHGEGLNDHGEAEHGIFLYRESLQVPLMIKLPKSRKGGDTIAAPVQLIDVFPTITRSLDIAEKREGQSLLAALPNDRPIYSETYYPRFHFGWSDLHSLISGASHYIQAPSPELYDLAADPTEHKNTLEENRRTYIALRDRITPFVKTAEAPKTVDPEQVKQLAALGYIGSTVTTKPGDKLPDPKDKISHSEAIRKAFKAFEEKNYEDAERRFAEALRDDPGMVDMWGMRARALARLGRYDEAIAAAKQGLRLSPTGSNLPILIANLALQQNHLDEAEKHARLAVAETPTEAHRLLAQIWMARKNFPKALEEANLSGGGGERDRPFAIVLEGRIAEEQGKLDEALRDYDRAEELVKARGHKPPPNLYFFRGDTLARMGRAPEAEEAFRREIAEYPTDPQAYKNLILLYVSEGKNDAATQVIFDLEKASPTPPSYVAISETLKIVGDRNGSRFWAARGLNKFPSDRQLQALWRG